ncbi:MAG TPA: hypothetical protein VGQ82_04115, partial [Chthoniobacterales bacterium]|nr:hypothetical protein [Chthoniobacterales bacterium]
MSAASALVTIAKEIEVGFMQTISRFPRLRGVVVGSVTLFMAAITGAASLAGQSGVARREPQSRVVKGKPACYVMSSASSIPTHCDRLGGIPTTTIPILIIGGNRALVASR